VVLHAGFLQQSEQRNEIACEMIEAISTDSSEESISLLALRPSQGM
jgi:hypothetical protein